MRIDSIKIGKFSVQMTEAEKKQLVAELEAHAEQFGTTHGFIARILEALRVRA